MVGKFLQRSLRPDADGVDDPSRLSRAFTYVAAEGFQKRDESCLLLNAEVARPDLRVKVGIETAAIGVELDHIFKRRQTAIMHVRRGTRDLAKRRRFERAVIPRDAGNREPSFIGKPTVAPGDSGVVEILVGEIRTDVATAAAALAAEQLQSRFFERVQRARAS